MATIKDVALRAGVSVGTVSAVLNNRSTASAAARKRVLQAIKELGYQPNELARGLRTQRSRAIGLLVSDITNPFFPDIARGAEDEARRNGLSVILCNTDEDLEREAEQIEMLIRYKVEGIIVTAARTDSPLRDYSDRVALVFVNRYIPGVEADFVGIDNVRAAEELTTHLIRLGHRRIALITGAHKSTASKDRVIGYERALRAEGIPFDPQLVVHGGLRYQGGWEAAEYLLGLPHPPTAVFAVDDIMALAVLDVAQRRGIRVPDELAVVGFDDIWVAQQAAIGLTTVRQPRHETGAMAVRLLLSRVRQRRRTPERIILPHELVIRRTCGYHGTKGPSGPQPAGPVAAPARVTYGLLEVKGVEQ